MWTRIFILFLFRSHIPLKNVWHYYIRSCVLRILWYLFYEKMVLPARPDNSFFLVSKQHLMEVLQVCLNIMESLDGQGLPEKKCRNCMQLIFVLIFRNLFHLLCWNLIPWQLNISDIIHNCNWVKIFRFVKLEGMHIVEKETHYTVRAIIFHYSKKWCVKMAQKISSSEAFCRAILYKRTEVLYHPPP